jgi:hypothetical protein
MIGMRLSVLAATAAVALSADMATAKDFKTSDNGTIDFDTPSMNMCCSYVPDASDAAHLSCSREKPKYWTVILEDSGKMTVYKNPGEVPGCGYGKPLGNVLGYGENWSAGGFTCTSAQTGLTCKLGRKGFSLSRKGLKELK